MKIGKILIAMCLLSCFVVHARATHKVSLATDTPASCESKISQELFEAEEALNKSTTELVSALSQHFQLGQSICTEFLENLRTKVNIYQTMVIQKREEFRLYSGWSTNIPYGESL